MLNVQISKKALSNMRGTRDLTFWVTGTIEPWLTPKGERLDIQKTVQKYKTRFKEAWEELAKR
jgi:hypothetical protein